MPNGHGETSADYARAAAHNAHEAARDADKRAQAETAYLHARIDQLIRQVALEIGLVRSMGDHLSREGTDQVIAMTANRFWVADEEAAHSCHRPPRSRS